MTESDVILPTDMAAAPAPAAAPPPARGALAVLVGIVLKPRGTFAYLRDHGGRSWLLPLVLALVLTLVARLMAVPIERAQAQAAFDAMQAQLEEQLPPGGDDVTVGGPVGGLGFSTGPGGAVGSTALFDYGLPVLGILGQWLLAGLVLLAFTWLLGGRPRAGAMLRMSAWALLVPVIARSLVAVAVMLATGRVPVAGLTALPGGGAPVVSSVDGEDLSEAPEDGGPQVVMIGPGGSAGAGPAYLDFLRSSFLSSLDIYTLWGLFLLAIGVAVTARLGWLKSTLATTGYWGLSLALAALPPVLSLWMMSLSGAGGLMPLP